MRGGQRRLVRPRRSTHSSGSAHGLLLPLPCFLPHPSLSPSTYDFSSCFFPKFKIMHFQNRDIKLYTVVLLFLCFLKFLLSLCCR